MSKIKVLITGGEGGMAKAIEEYLKKKNEYEVKSMSRKNMDITKYFEVNKIVSDFKPEVIINTAGYINPDVLVKTGILDFIHHFEVNTFGLFYSIKFGIKNGCTTFINIGSTSAFEGRDKWGAYCASKAAAMSLTETLAREGYESYTIHPSRTATKMRERLFPDEDKNTLMNPDRVAEFVSKCLNYEFKNGSHIILKKEYYYVLPMRDCLK